MTQNSYTKLIICDVACTRFNDTSFSLNMILHRNFFNICHKLDYSSGDSLLDRVLVFEYVTEIDYLYDYFQ